MIFKVKWVDETASTNSDLKEAARLGAPLGSVLAARRQSGGRGRMGRAFYSGGGGLYMSVILPMETPERAGVLTTYAAVATARAVERLFDVNVKIKWVNDLYVGGKKVCGILAEGVATEWGYRAVLGIGVNICNELPNELAEIATTLFAECGKKIRPDVLAEAILHEFENFENADFAETLDEYRHKCFVIGENITVISHSDTTFEAKALEVLDDGSLLVKRLDSGEEVRVFSGEVSTKISRGEK